MPNNTSSHRFIDEAYQDTLVSVTEYIKGKKVFRIIIRTV